MKEKDEKVTPTIRIPIGAALDERRNVDKEPRSSLAMSFSVVITALFPIRSPPTSWLRPSRWCIPHTPMCS